MDWTPLVTSTMFDGIKTDMVTAAGGILMIGLICLGVGILISVFMHR